MELKQAQHLLISLYKIEIENTQYFCTQNKFDVYVKESCKILGKNPKFLSDKDLLEFSYDFINDNYNYLFSE